MNVLTLSFFLLTACLNTSSDDWKKDRSVSNFSGLSVSSGIDVYLTQGNSEKLILDVKGLDEDQVISEVRNGTLRLYVERKGLMGWNWGKNTYVKAYLTFRQLKAIQASGGADILGQDRMTFNNLNLEVSGGADVKLALRADDLNVSASGGADVTVQGSARSLNAEGSGGADLDARKLIVETCNASSSGGSDVYVNATQELRMKASGGSDIYYYGPAKVLAKSESGGSDIKRKD